ncbi:flagellar protein [Bacillus piscicola]|uniref:flagellar protein n=1 Tax=Bacillus piscicola TaxID=1632684 RepID=UPI001F08FF98|nr:flagellar protein [Bacillus piscicola]
MALVKELFLATKALHDHVHAPLPASLEKRESYLEQLDLLLEERALLLDQLTGKQTFSEGEKRLGQEMMKMNEGINRRMTETKGTMRLDIQHLQRKKESGQRYEKPYDGPTIDGVFFDKKN